MHTQPTPIRRRCYRPSPCRAPAARLRACASRATFRAHSIRRRAAAFTRAARSRSTCAGGPSRACNRDRTDSRRPAISSRRHRELTLEAAQCETRARMPYARDPVEPLAEEALVTFGPVDGDLDEVI